MKKYCTLLLLLSGVAAQAQIHIGSKEIPTMNIAGKISKSQLEDFKNSTTVFTLQFRDYAQQQEYQQAIAAVWKVTPFKIIKPEDIGNYEGKGYSIFSFGAFSVQTHSATHTHFSYDLWLPEEKKNGNVKQHYLARVWLSPNGAVLLKDRRYGGATSRVYTKNMLPYIYQEAVFYNWSPGQLKGYLKEVNDALVAGKEQGPYSEHTEALSLKELKTDTLYIPDYAFLKFNKFTGAEKMEQPDWEELKKDYPYPLKIVSTKDLDALILSGKAIKYLVYVKSSTEKFVDVYDAQSGRMLYGRYVKISYDFKSKDLKELAKVIR